MRSAAGGARRSKTDYSSCFTGAGSRRRTCIAGTTAIAFPRLTHPSRSRKQSKNSAGVERGGARASYLFSETSLSPLQASSRALLSCHPEAGAARRGTSPTVLITPPPVRNLKSFGEVPRRLRGPRITSYLPALAPNESVWAAQPVEE